jgi:hypothetical protein
VRGPAMSPGVPPVGEAGRDRERWPPPPQGRSAAACDVRRRSGPYRPGAAAVPVWAARRERAVPGACGRRPAAAAPARPPSAASGTGRPSVGASDPGLRPGYSMTPLRG